MTDAPTCPKHGCERVLHYNGQKNKRTWRCLQCNKERKLNGWAKYREHDRARRKIVHSPNNTDPLRIRRSRQIRLELRKGIINLSACERCGLNPEARDAAGRRLVYATFDEHDSPIIWLCSRCAGIKRQTVLPEQF